MIFKTYEELTKDELFDLLKLRTDVFVVEQECAYPEIDHIDKDAIHLLKYAGNRLIGYLRLYYKSDTEVQIGRVVVEKEFRSKGIAREIMLGAENHISNNPKNQSVFISAQSYLIDFYKSLKYEIVSEEYLEDGIPHIDMKKPLSV